MLPESIPAVTVSGRYLTPDGTPLSGKVVFRAPALLTFSEADVMLSGPVTAPLDSTGAFAATLPATDAPGMDPVGWSYTVSEQLAGVPSNRSYQVLLPLDTPEVDLADVAPVDPTTPNYVRGQSAYELAVAEGFEGTPVQWLDSLTGPSAYEVAVACGFTGTEVEWLASLKGEKGDPGHGSVDSVNGDFGPDVVLDAAAVGAVPDTAPGAPGGVAQLDAEGLLAAAQRPAYTAADVGAIPTAARGAAGGVATLDASGHVPAAQLPPIASAGTYSVRDFGAVGDGITDDAPAFRAALDAAAAAGGGTVRIPAGVFLMDSARGAWPAPCLYVRGNTAIHADDGAIIRRGLNMGARMVQNFDGTESNSGYTGHSNIRVTGGTWDGNAPAKVGSGNMFAFAHAERITLDHVRIIDQPNNHAIELNSVSVATVEFCRFEGCVPKPDSPQTTEAIQIDGALGEVGLEGGLPYDGTHSRDVTVTRCYTGPSAKCGPWGLLVGSHASDTVGNYRRISVIGNTIADTLVYGVRAYDWYDSVIANNTIGGTNRAGYRAGIMVTSGKTKCDGVIVTGNVLNNVGGAGYGAIEAEQLSGASQAGGLVISNNIISGYSGDGIKVTADAPQIHMNFIRAAQSGATLGLNVPDDGSHGNIALNRITGGRGASVPAGAIVYGNDPAITPPAA